jgi:hypothetical protein
MGGPNAGVGTARSVVDRSDHLNRGGRSGSAGPKQQCGHKAAADGQSQSPRDGGRVRRGQLGSRQLEDMPSEIRPQYRGRAIIDHRRENIFIIHFIRSFFIGWTSAWR